MFFLKLGGSLITDKTREMAVRADVIRRAAQETRAALRLHPDLRLVLGHGSGSFGHYVAQQLGLLAGPPNWWGYAQTGAAAARLNRLVTDIFLEAGVPVVSVQPSASAHCRDGALIYLDTAPIRDLLAAGCVPIVYGDVALDDARGYTIISTEQIFAYLAQTLSPTRIILAGEVAGVFTADPTRHPAARPIPVITPAHLHAVESQLGGAAGFDVTGGMLSKVREMLALVERQPGLEVWLVSGLEAGAIQTALAGRRLSFGTILRCQLPQTERR